MAQQEADQQLRGAKHCQHKDQYADGVVGKTLEEHLAHARCLGQYRHLLVAMAQYLGTA
ncbi:hypothetical protein D3C81_2179530 [compost metagenome]